MAQFTPPLSPAEVQSCFPGRYTTVSAVHVGGQGAVFKCVPPAGLAEAVKIYVPDPTAQVDDRTRREVDALKRLSCDTIVPLVDDGGVSVRGMPCRFVITEFIEGRSIEELLTAGPLSVGATAQVGYDIASAIEAMWSSPARIVHRDIKPPNVMAADVGRAVLIDLGIARHTSLSTLTAVGVAWGTLGFMSPEQYQGAKMLSCRSDIFSLGVLMYTCLACRHPTGRDQRALITVCPPAMTASTSAPAAMTALVDRMLSQKTVNRPMPDEVRATLAPMLVNIPW